MHLDDRLPRVRLDVRQLKAMHPLLPAATAADRALCAAVGLGRHGHMPGIRMLASVDVDEHQAEVHWESAAMTDEQVLDRHRVTEDAAEAISLALVHAAHGWVVRRRLARGEAADWLLRDADNNLIALEVSGIDSGQIGTRLLQKRRQAGRALAAPSRHAAVVELATPRAVVAAADTE